VWLIDIDSVVIAIDPRIRAAAARSVVSEIRRLE
jgi:hypothetical protein